MGLLDGKVGLIVGVANDRSYAWHIANAITLHGGTCVHAHVPGEKNERRTRKALDKIEGGQGVPMFPCNAGADEDLDALFESYAGLHDRMDFLVHSIAFADREWLEPGNFTRTPREVFTAALDISAYTLAAMSDRARPLLRASGGGSVMCMSYYGGEKVVPGYNVMGVAKAALESTARYLASELGEDGTRVNTISGGYLRTLASSAVKGTDVFDEHAAKKAPLRRNVEGSDVGGTAVWLASDLSRGVTGETIYVDCGVNTIGA